MSDSAVDDIARLLNAGVDSSALVEVISDYFNEGPEEDVLGMLHKPHYNTKEFLLCYLIKES